ncbi:MAG: hypothetical protein M3046_10420 [Actinomycetota bacterium]|nr:hypothetical protein [Actinomycetota bacterium]
MSDAEVRALGYEGHDDRGVWQRPSRPALDRRTRHRAIGARRCLSCGVDPRERDHLEFCPDALPSVGRAARDCRDLEAAIAWEPPELDLPKLTPFEREQLATLFDALVRAREQARGETAPKLWTIREYLDTVARDRKGAV